MQRRAIQGLELDGRRLTVHEVAAVSRGAASVHLAPCAREAMTRSVELRRRLLEDDHQVYGLTTGFGDNCGRIVPAAWAEELQRNLVMGHLSGAGEPARPEVIRATMLIRGNCLARGHSGIRPELVDVMMEMVARDVVPVVPRRGSLGASGDLVPLSYIAAALLGEGAVWHRGVLRSAADALRTEGLSAVRLEAREGLALINGTSFAAGNAVMSLSLATRIAEAADLATAMTCQALLGNRRHFDEAIHRFKAHAGQKESAAAIRRALGGWQRDDDAGLRIQDPYSLRCAPQVVGVLRDTLRWAEEWITTEMNSSCDNPLFDPGLGVAHHGGNFYAGHVGQAMEAVKLAVANVADLIDRQLQLLVDEKFNRGLTPNLVSRGRAVHEAGLHQGFKSLQIVSSALTGEALHAASPAMSYSRSTEAHNQDKVSMGTTAAQQALDLCETVKRVLAIHLMAAGQALDLRGAESRTSLVDHARRLIRIHVPFIETDQRFDFFVDAVELLIARGALLPPTSWS